jgi:hypothetical protein
MITLPRDDLKKHEILQMIAKKDKEYPKQEVNETIKSFLDITNSFFLNK